MSRSVSVSSETSSVQYEEEPLIFVQFEHSRESPMSGPVVLTFRGSRRRTDAWGGGGSSSRVIRITVSGGPCQGIRFASSEILNGSGARGSVVRSA